MNLKNGCVSLLVVHVAWQSELGGGHNSVAVEPAAATGFIHREAFHGLQRKEPFEENFQLLRQGLVNVSRWRGPLYLARAPEFAMTVLQDVIEAFASALDS
mmetsp:Transcript_64903/g.152645  ORF Transcript_64903/g.152645 Transcript_64903/m.152645 type:complete len:101 (+) Transcript_64903:131-433(+)